jgi:protoporphyrinogen/coproporphyrinogen III oxidase
VGHPERLARIDDALAAHQGLAVAGAAYAGVGIPDCIRSGELAADSVVHAVAGARA